MDSMRICQILSVWNERFEDKRILFLLEKSYIKKGGFMIKINGNSDKAKKNCLVIFIVIIIGLVIFLCYYLNKISDYEKVEANIVSISTHHSSGTATKKSTKAYYVTYEYTYKDVKYQAIQQALTKIGKSQGDLLYYN